MLVMVSNATGTEVGLLAGRYPGRIGHLYSPGGQRGPWDEIPFALDNGAWGARLNGEPWSEDEWRRLLTWAALCGIRPLWVVVPDVVANRELTLERWAAFAPVARAYKWRPAFAVQDGMTFDDVPDSDCMLFIGGSDEWKDRSIAPWSARFPGRVHVARVNGWDRLYRCWRAGVVSIDGTGWFHRNNSKNSSQFATLKKFLRETSISERSAA